MDRPLKTLGVFDSGVGGLTVARALRAACPQLQIHYFGDTARVPYGNKSPGTIRRYALAIARFLLRRGVDGLVVACNTMAAVALDDIQTLSIPPVWDVVSAGAASAAKKSPGGRIGVIGTRATCKAKAYGQAIAELRPEALVFHEPCPLFVPLVEEGWEDDEVAKQVALRYLAPLLEKNIDTLVLGCTHYPPLIPVIRSIVGDEVQIVSSAAATAHSVAGDVGGRATDRGGIQAYVTDAASHFETVAKRLLGEDLHHLHLLTEGEWPC